MRATCLAYVAGFAALCASSSIAATGNNAAVVQSCIQQTGAPGTYETTSGASVPQVVAGPRGTVRGAAAVNDCLNDAFQVQFGATGSVETARVETNGISCREERNAGVVAGLILTAGTVGILGGTDGAVLGGVVGSVVGIRGLNKQYHECAARRGNENIGSARIPNYRCGHGAAPLQGGNGYCR